MKVIIFALLGMVGCYYNPIQAAAKDIISGPTTKPVRIYASGTSREQQIGSPLLNLIMKISLNSGGTSNDPIVWEGTVTEIGTIAQLPRAPLRLSVRRATGSYIGSAFISPDQTANIKGVTILNEPWSLLITLDNGQLEQVPLRAVRHQ